MQVIFRMRLRIVLFDISTLYFLSCNPTTFILSTYNYTKLFVIKAICTAWKDIKIEISETIVESRSKINLSCENSSLKC